MAQNDTQRQQQMDAWLAGPVSKPPPGVSSDFVNGPSLHEYDIICQTICLTLVTLFVAVRIYTKSTVLKSLGWDDGGLICDTIRKRQLTTALATSVVAWVRVPRLS